MAVSPPRRMPPVPPPMALSVSTGTASGPVGNTSRADSLSSPPPASSRTNTWSSRHRASKGKRKGPTVKSQAPPRETFLDDITPVDEMRAPAEHAPGQSSSSTAAIEPRRDSHDLAFSPQRDSLVDNLLHSLDQYSPHAGRPPAGLARTGPGNFSSTVMDDGADEGDMPPTVPYNRANMGRRRGHTHSTSRSSDQDFNSNSTTRGQRSNSGSTFVPNMDRIESFRGFDRDGGVEYQAPTVPRSSAERKAAAHSRSGRKSKGGKSSTSSSLDLGHAPNLGGNHAWATLTRKRSNSLDVGYSDRPAIPPSRGRMNDDYEQQSNNFMYDHYDSAPTPTIPVGPRRYGSASGDITPPPQPSHPPPRTPLREFTREQPSSQSLQGKEKSKTLGSSGLKNLVSGRSFADTKGRDFSSMPAFVDTGGVDHDRPDQVAAAATTRAAPATSKERPGFFRRVFGGTSKNANSNNSNQTPPKLPPVNAQTSRNKSLRPETGVDERPKQSSDMPPPPSTAPHPTNETPPHPLNKKPSSFFRRRKKSTSDAPVPPVLPLHLQPPSANRDVPEAAKSPVSSLRQVMNPYLEHGADASETFYDTSEHMRTDKGKAYDNNVAQDDPTPKASKMGARPPADDSGARGTPKNKACVPNGPESPLGRDVDSKSLLQDKTPTQKRGGERAMRPLESSTNRNNEQNSAQKNGKGSREEGHLLLRPSEKENDKSMPRELGPQGEKRSPRVKTKKKPSVEWIKTTPSKLERSGLSSGENTPKRVWLEPTSSEENLAQASRSSLPIPSSREAVPGSGSSSDYKSVSSIPAVKVEDRSSKRRSSLGDIPPDINISASQAEEPTLADIDRAKRIFFATDPEITKDKATPWLGDCLPVNIRTRKAYLDLFDWTNTSILSAMRDLCSKLVLKGETQQVDRLLDGLSHRWCACNPNHGFKATDVVHTICYSIILLNTDLHLADIDQKMTRTQFVKNTLPTIRRVVADAAPEAFEARRASTLPVRGQLPWQEPRSPNKSTHDTFLDAEKSKSSLDFEGSSNRHSRRPSQLEDLPGRAGTPLDFDTNDDCGPLVKAPFSGSGRAWEVQVDAVLKSFYSSIRQHRLPLHGAPTEQHAESPAPSNSLQVLTGGVLKRSPSNVSKTPSDNFSARGRPEAYRLGTGRWSSKTRSKTKLPSNGNLDSGRTSFDDQSSMWSPSVSSTWSKYSFGKTQTSMSVDSLGSAYPQGDYQRSIGFANALSQAIVREDTQASTALEERVAPLLEDDSLELAGAPWAKEGILTHKHHLEPFGKRAKDRNWNECFAVIEKGWMRLFSFTGKGSTRHRNKPRMPAGGVVGGGNWSENAEALGSFLLRQTIASALPPPGYSKTRPHVWALSLPTGAVHLFQVGTPEIVKEFVTSANYWSARLSKEPLVGGVSNVEYGWGDSVINNALLNIDPLPNRPSSSLTRPSIQSSIRSSIDHGNSVRPRLPGDKLLISDWSPPQQSMFASQLMEVDQLKALQTYVHNIETELQKHNELRSPMLLAFSARHPNGAKAMSNWERKSSYLLREIVKFRTYIDSLTAAQNQKASIYAERNKENQQKGEEESATT